jgi:serine/threonine protein kinase
LEPLGSGSLGDTFLVRHRETAQRFAVTRFHEAVMRSPDFEAFRAARLPALRAFRPPGIVPISPFFEIDDGIAVASAFLAGEDVRRYRGRSMAEILDVFEPMIQTLGECHVAGFVHGGLHPRNLLCDAEGRIQIKGLGFGELVHRIETSRERRLAAAGAELSPALRAGDALPTAKDDLFALGGLLYEWVAARPPPRVDPSHPQILPPIQPRGDGAGSDAEAARRLSVLVARLRQPDPNARPPSIGDILVELAEIRAQLPAAAGSPRPSKQSTPAARPTAPDRTNSSGPGPLAAAAAEPSESALAGRSVQRAWIGLIAFALLGAGLLLWFELHPPEAGRAAGAPPSDVDRPVDAVAGAALSAPTGSTLTESPTAESGARPSPAAGPSSFETERLLSELEAAFDEIQQRLDRIAERGAETWNGASFSDLNDEVASLREALSLRDAVAARRASDSAVDRLDALEAEAESRLETALREGAAALDNEEVERASEAYESALILDPENEAARQGRTRAERRPQVLENLEASRAAAARPNGLEEALRSASIAVDLDPEHAASRAQLRNLEQRRAREALAQAISKHRTRAAAFEADEQWPLAVAEYEAALARGADLAFARQGLERARARAAIDARLRVLAEKPASIFSPAGRKEASQALEEAQAIDAPGDRLREQILFVAENLARAETPRPIRLRSDSETDVAIFHVGRQGRFETRGLELLPGTYTIVGTRNGYRDVRKTLEVPPGAEPIEFMIRCEEAL